MTEAANMSAEELYALANEKATAEPARFRTVNIDGLTVTFDLVKAASWTAFRKSCAIDLSHPTFDVIDQVFDLIAYTSDANEAVIVEHCGGEDAKRDDVLILARKIANEVWKKN